ncbi:MAG: hypothetical protein HY307_01575, partial [Arcobacter sp.]|nr:hypothetical protein [Arcobacter sp.]
TIQLFTSRIIEIIIIGFLFHFRANDMNLEEKGYIIGYVSLALALIIPIFIYVIFVGGLIYGTYSEKNKEMVEDIIGKEEQKELSEEDIEISFYDIAMKEIDENKKVNGIWGKSFSEANGDINISKALYLKYRVEYLHREHQSLSIVV